MTETLIYLSRSEVAELIGVKSATLSRFKLPEPDAYIGPIQGWLPETIDAWSTDRPGRGHSWDTTTPASKPGKGRPWRRGHKVETSRGSGYPRLKA